MRNNALCKDTHRRAQMARWRAVHPGYMSAAARHHKELREQKLRKQQQAQAKTAQEVCGRGRSHVNLRFRQFQCRRIPPFFTARAIDEYHVSPLFRIRIALCPVKTREFALAIRFALFGDDVNIDPRLGVFSFYVEP